MSEPFRVHTRWIETEWAGGLEPFPPSSPTTEPAERERVTVEVAGRRLEVVLPAGLGARGGAGRQKPPSRRGGGGAAAATSGETLAAPMQGTIVKVAVEEGQQVAEGDLVVVLEAMKMEQPITAHRSGTVKQLTAAVGAPVQAGAPICTITD